MKNPIIKLTDKWAEKKSLEIDMENKDKIGWFLGLHKNWNNGVGLIVSKVIGKRLKKLGFKEGEGFTISRKLSN